MKDSVNAGVDDVGGDGEAATAARGRPPDVDVAAAKSNSADAPIHHQQERNGSQRYPGVNISDLPNLKIISSPSSRIATKAVAAAASGGGTSKAQEQFPSRVRKEGAGMEEAAQEAGSDTNDGQGGEGEDRVRLLVGSFNVGNSPLVDLAPWLPDGGKGFDLIVVGLQESTYKAPRGARDSPLVRCNSVSPIASPQRTVSGASIGGGVSPRWAAMQMHAAEMGDYTPPPGQGFSVPPSPLPMGELQSPHPKSRHLTSLPSPHRNASDSSLNRLSSSARYRSPSITAFAESASHMVAGQASAQTLSVGEQKANLGKPSGHYGNSRSNPLRMHSSNINLGTPSVSISGRGHSSGKISRSDLWNTSIHDGLAGSTSSPAPTSKGHETAGRRHSETARSSAGHGAVAAGVASSFHDTTTVASRRPWASPEKQSAREARRRQELCETEDRGGGDGGEEGGGARSEELSRSVTESGKKALLGASPDNSVGGIMSPKSGTPTVPKSRPGSVEASPSLSAGSTPPQPEAGLSRSLPSALPNDRVDWELRSGAERSVSGRIGTIGSDWASTSNSVPNLGSKDLSRFGRARKAVKKRTKELDAGAAHLRSVLSRHLGPDFEQVISLRRMQMRVKVFLRRSLLSVYDHEEGESTAENTGIGKVVANKGGLVCKLRLKGTTLCFISCHLQAHEGQNHLARRNASCAEILQGARLGDRRNVDVDSQFHHVFWFGDMNYRIGFGLQPEDAHARVTELVNAEQWPKLWEGDELLRELKAGHLLAGFQTEPPAFAPTFKTFRGTKHGYSTKRVPSYTDRILWKSLPGHAPNLDLLTFTSFPEITSSDHKPIHAAFSIRLTPEVKPPPLPEGGKARLRPRMPTVRDVPRMTHLQHSARLVFEELHASNLMEIAGGGVRNPFVAFSSDPKHLLEASGKLKTDVKRKTLSPRWLKKYTCQLSVSDPTLLEHSHVSLLVWDREAMVGSKNELLGVANISLAEVMRNSYPHKQRPPPSPSPTGMSISRRLSIQNFLNPSRRRSSSPVSVQTPRNAQGDGGRGVRGGGGGDGGGGSGGRGERGQCSHSPALGAKTTTTPTSPQAATKGEDWKRDETDAADGNGHKNSCNRKSSSGCGGARHLGGGGAAGGGEAGKDGEVGVEGFRAGDSIIVSAGPSLRRYNHHQFNTSRRYSFKDGLEFDLPLIRYGLERGRISGRCILVRDRGWGGGGGAGGGFRGAIGGDSVSERPGSIRKAAMNKKATSTRRKGKRFFLKGPRKGDGEVKEESKDGYVRGSYEDGEVAGSGGGSGGGEGKSNARDPGSLADVEDKSKRENKAEWDISGSERRRRKIATGGDGCKMS